MQSLLSVSWGFGVETNSLHSLFRDEAIRFVMLTAFSFFSLSESFLSC
jgi:hypothetical protein